MRSKGTIVEWRDDRGFGFIEPGSGGEKIFCHVKAFAVRVRRPQAGDAVTYVTTTDKQGRMQATDVRPSGLETAWYTSNVRTRTPHRPGSRTHSRSRSSAWPYVLVALFASALAVLVAMERISFFVPVIYVCMSGITLLLYAFDKSAALNKRRRTREQTLHVFEVVGGWPGGLIAQTAFRHKSAKTSFRIEFWVCVMLNITALSLFSGLVP